MSRPEQQFRIAEIEVAKHPADDKIIGIFRFESAGPIKNGPLLLIVAEVHSTMYVYERLLDVLNAAADRARLMVAGVGQDPVGRFEKLVQRLNEAVADFVRDEATNLSWNRINVFVMELSEGHLCLAGTGKLTNLFLQKQADPAAGGAGGTFRSFDLLGSLEQPVQADPKKFFASLICGDIKPGDLLFVGSTNLDRLRGELRIKERLSTLPPVTAALEIRQDLEKRGIPDNFVAAIIACTETKPAPEKPAVEAKPTGSTESIEKLRKNEQETNQHLSPVITPIKATVAGFDWRAQAAKAGGWIRKRLASLRPSHPTGERPREAMAMQSLRGMNAGYGSMFTKKRKIILGSVGGALLLIIIGVSWWNHSKKVAAETAAWNATFASADDKRTRAESDLLYSESQARSDLASADDIVKSLSADTAERKQKLDALKRNLADLHEKLKREIKLDGVAELASLGPVAPEGSLVAPILIKDTAYVVDASGSAILKINVATKTTKRIALPAGASDIVSATEGSTSILFATKGAKLFAVNKSDDSVTAMGWSHSRTSSTAAIVLYASKLYSLDPSRNQVWRSANSGGGFSGETAYIKASNASLTNAVGMAIDSNVYVLNNDGSLMRFLSGGQEGFALNPVDPPLRAGSSIWANVDSTYLYITDPADKRILIFDKNGALKAQLTSSQLLSPRAISVDELNKKAIVVDGNRLVLITLP